MNGDGYADLALGAHGYQDGEGGFGGAWIHYGSKDGLVEEAAWSVLGNQEDSMFGSTLAGCGDVNGDGFADVIVGAYRNDNDEIDSGRTFLFLGEPSRLGGIEQWSTQGEQVVSRAGYSVANIGDVNGDGFSDLATGVPYFDGVGTNSGIVLLHYGGAIGFSEDADQVLNGRQAEALFGFSVSGAGDVNGDGYADLIVGAPHWQEGETQEGRSFLYYGSEMGVADNPGWIAESNQANAMYGYSVSSAGDVNGDGFHDVVIGAYSYSNGESGEGGAFVYLGSSEGLSDKAEWSAEGDQVLAHFGGCVAAAGDVNRDGYSDVLVGSHIYDRQHQDEGAVFLYYGSGQGLSPTAGWMASAGVESANFGIAVAGVGDVNGDGFSDVLVGADTYANGESNEGATILFLGSSRGLSENQKHESNRSGSHFGAAVTGAGDLDGDGYSDVLIGAPLWEKSGATHGMAFAVYGGPDGLAFDRAVGLSGDQANSQFGFAVAGGSDYNNDGFSDVVVGIPSYNGVSTGCGKVAAYFGGGLGIPLMVQQFYANSNVAISPGGVSDANGFRATVQGRYPGGRGKLKLQVEHAAFSTDFGTLPTPENLVTSQLWIETVTGPVEIFLEIPGLQEYRAYHWRGRLMYAYNDLLGQRYSRWFSIPDRTVSDLHFRTYDDTPPNNPSEVVETNGAADGVWQNDCATARFTWNGASDQFGSGVKNYDLYWGADPDGATAVLTTTRQQFTPNTVPSPSVNYLRIRTRDHQDNVSEWETVFVLMYDNTPPSAPLTVTEASGAQAHTWQSAIRSPHFTWSGESDGQGSGIDRYEIAWSTNPDSETVVSTTNTSSYNAPAVSTPSTNYLRMRLVDSVGNASEWRTLFVFQYDASPPISPEYAVEATGVRSGEWQNTVSEPLFNWFGASDGNGSGIKEFDVYWGTDRIGEDVFQTNSTAAFTTGNVPSPSVYFLRVRARDRIGNTSIWKTLFTFQYDNTPPTCPSDCVESCGAISDVWQNTVDAPSFSWAGSSDHGGSGMKGFDVYWGPDATGTSIIETGSGPAFMPNAITGTQIMYLRARARDHLNNVSRWVNLFTYRYDSDAPTIPNSATEENGTVSDVWQNTVAKLSYTWSGAEDGYGSGIRGYNVYWGDDSAGTSTVTQLQGSPYRPAAPENPSVNYLRVQVRDNVGNLSPWTTLFIARYDDEPPSNPPEVVAQDPVEDNLWQSHVSDPQFTWEAGSDGNGSGVLEYDICWGTDPDSTLVTATVAEEVFDPTAVASLAVHYLRMRTRDIVGNVSDWETMFTFKYDESTPKNPTAVTENHGAEDGVWQNTVPDPEFAWTGAEASSPDVAIRNYDVYWGPDPDGTTVTATPSDPTYDPGPVESPSTTYLRLRARDVLGNVAEWKTMFVFQYDNTPPENPVAGSESGGSKDGVWQNTVNAGLFVWSSGDDGAGSGVADYDIFFGLDPGNPSVTATTDGTAFRAEAVASPSINSLLVRTRDQVGNVSDWSLLFTFQYDKTPPTNPLYAQDTGGAEDGVWQSDTRNPLLSWSGAADPDGVGVLNYDVYWGVVGSGTQVIVTTENTVFDPPLVESPSTNFLRVRTRDRLGNLSAWTTLFTFQYDHTPPFNPVGAVEVSGARNAVPQSDVFDPAFTWYGSSDGIGSGTKEFDVYWGTEPAGTTIVATTSDSAYDPPPPPESGAYYLRVRGRDLLDNESSWKTLFQFIYDHTKPTNPTRMVETGGAQNGKWQNTVSAPTFNWGGATASQGGQITQYDVYWGTDPYGTSASVPVSATTFSPPPVQGTVIRYLRIRTRDNQGGVSEWLTMFKFMYDGNAPSNPTAIVERSGAASATWQNTVASPTFSWSGMSDNGGSGVTAFDVSWSTDPDSVTDTVRTASADYSAPAAVSPSVHYLKLRTRDAVGNTSDWVTLFTHNYDATPPTNPDLATEQGGSQNDIWQGDVSNPSFTWTGDTDGAGSGIDSYDVSWGTVKNGTRTVTTVSQSAFNARNANSPSVWYLSVRTRDKAGNVADWAPLFTYRFDQTPPTNPTGTTEDGGAPNDMEQSLVSDPSFSWTGADDGTGSGIDNYDVYWGHDPAGETVLHQTGFASYDPPAATEADPYYLRVRTRDHVGNLAGWSTQFIFRYDPTIPSNPVSATETNGAVSEQWQKDVSTPHFVWSGAKGGIGAAIEGYDVYFGPEPYGTTVLVQLESEEFSSVAVDSPSISYLRVRTRDNFGGISDWSTLFEFRYDAENPTPPGSVSENSGVASNQWQSTTDTPTFTWSAGSDGMGSGIKEYDVYFGEDPAGDHITNTVAESSWTGTPVDSPATSYLRLRSRDNVGNESDWKDMFVFRHDSTPPVNPTSATNTAGIRDASWQNRVSTPTFVWADGDDGEGSGLNGYDVYWGRNANGSSSVDSTVLGRYAAPKAESPSIYYLRVRSKDKAGNRADWVRLFTFQYDASPPTNPTTTLELNGSLSSVPEGGVFEPQFTWSGADDGTGIGVGIYDIYWGLEEDGEDISYVTSEAAFVPRPVTATGVWFLRLRTHDLLDNTAEWADAFVFNYVHGKPGAPRSATEVNGAADRVWQSHVAAPSFIWSGARGGAGADVQSYDVYWGPDRRGTSPFDNVTDAAYEPDPASSTGVSYLRVRTKDTMGGVGEWATLFEFRYDGDPPTNPDSVTEMHGIVTSVWQASVDAPAFTWIGATDGDGSGIYNYDVYFNPENTGTDVLCSTTGTNYQCDPVTDSPEIYYFRIRTVDVAGNISDWTTLFEFYYDATPPDNAQQVVETQGVANDTWQKDINSPVFLWSGAADTGGSGIRNYDVFWGTDDTTPRKVLTTPDPTYAPHPVRGSESYLLAIRTRDKAGNHSDWDTLFTYKYDELPPIPPTTALETHGAQNRERQSEVSQPSFTWLDADDGNGSGTLNYDVYWGASLTGVDGAVTVTDPAFDAPEMDDKGTRYLRIRARDILENVSDWQTVFTFIYDEGEPGNPTETLEQGGAQDGVWQCDVIKPIFTWSGAKAGAGAEVKNYDVYWGLNRFGNQAVTTTVDATFAPGKVQETGVYYLRIRTRDTFDAVAGWKTCFTFKYDGDAPTNASVATEAHGVPNGVWEDEVGDLTFVWEGESDGIGSGTKEFEIYWGTDVAGQTVMKVTSEALFGGTVGTSPSMNFLRVRTRDVVGNVSDWQTLYTVYYDNTPPSNPTNAMETTGVQDGTWQNRIGSPLFSWSGADDGTGSGVQGYDVYWGGDPSGATTVLSTHGPNYHAPQCPTPSINHLRIRTRDSAGNVSNWTSLFTFQYDITPPTLPTSVIEANGVRDNDRQGAVANPSFSWSGATDGEGVGLKNYDVYWGTDDSGTQIVANATEASYVPAPVQETNTYFLRLRTRDLLGNESDWATIFRFKFDHLAPVNPDRVTEAGGAQSGVWQNVVDAPVFSWSGAKASAGAEIVSYDVYWGTDAFGHDVSATVSDASFTPPSVSGVAVYFLRIRTNDSEGGVSDWTTLFEFRYDGEAPTGPTLATEAAGSKDGIWQNGVQAPLFAWPGADDGDGCGIGYYDLYFGPEADGIIINASPESASCQIDSVSSPSVNYLRVRTHDECGNSSTWATLFSFKYDDTAPPAPSSASETNGAQDGVWESDITSPIFSWSPVSDGEGSGVTGYDIYWGTDSAGSQKIAQVQREAYRPGPLSRAGTYYLRGRTLDDAGNQGDWATLFTFRYDNTPPANPDTVVEVHGVEDGVAQSSIIEPTFTWSGAEDGTGSGVAGYDIFWGNNPDGEVLDATARTAVYSPGSVTGEADLYLRVRTWDRAGNVSDWGTLFNFKYDPGIPSNPTSATETNGAQDGVWQHAITAPVFVWSGAHAGEGANVQEYDVYWGTNPFGSDVAATVEDASFTPGNIGSTGIYYLRVRTRDSVGNTAHWTTLFAFHLDLDAPTNPTHFSDTMGTRTNTWQASVNAPLFNWSKATDGNGSGVSSYDLAWSTNPTATDIVASTDSTAFRPPALSQLSAMYYLRVRTWDVAGNSSDWSTVYVFQYDGSPPMNPDTIVEAAGVRSASWQNAISAPQFSWSGASDDAGSGISGYDIYWGNSPSGDSALLKTNSTSFQPHPVESPGIRFLRIRTYDIAGNVSSWTTLFTFQYDATPPSNPTSVTESNGTISDVVQGSVDQPVFTWEGADDGDGSGVWGYDIYWGEDAEGTVISATATEPTYALDNELTKGTYYLRIRTRDKVNNVSDWDTLFVFRFDPGVPTNPNSVTELNGAQDGEWQNTVDTPTFNWTGAQAGAGAKITGYDLHWGPDPTGTDATASVRDASWTAPTVSEVGLSYLRLRTKDNQGGVSGWQTLFTFQYDPEHTQHPPVQAVEQKRTSPGTWQSLVTTPLFQWSGADDGDGSGIESYDVYFGPSSASGTAIATVNGATYLAGQPSSPSISYLRVRATDQVGNQSAWATLFQFNFDATAPSSPGSATETNGVQDGEWQNSITSPSFIWPDSDDGEGSGVSGYDVAWSTKPDISTVQARTNTPSHIPASVQTVSVHYLRTRSRDTVGNVSEWSTSFAFKYDDEAPVLPPLAIETNGTPNDVTQSAVIDPAFTWDEADEGDGSGVIGYDVYWGEDPSGVTVSATPTEPLFDPPEMTESAAMYLRVRAYDQAGNISDWATLFTFRFDGGVPTNPAVVEANGLQSDLWQNLIYDPAFRWDGAQGGVGADVTEYDVYWGTDAAGEDITATTSEQIFDPPALSEDVATYYLRIRTHDSNGGVAPWQTGYVFRYDSVPPDNPTNATESNGVASETWQVDISAPDFSWSGANDHDGSDVAGYDVYWGTDTNGDSIAVTTLTPEFSAEGVTDSPVVYFLKVRAQDNAGNHADWSQPLFTFQFDKTPPTNPTSTQETGGSQHDVWQNAIGNPSLAWDGADDGEGVGVKEYDLYWGADPHGEAVVLTTSDTSYSSQVGSPAVRYLRARTRDLLGNTSDWGTLFTFKYDSTPPTNPTSVEEENGARSGIDQGSVDAPSFNWSGADDGAGSGVGSYDIYWGAQEDGSVVSATSTVPSYDPGQVESPSTTYLRVRTHDLADNVADWTTLFEFKYDENTPTLPTEVEELGGAEDRVWNNSVTTPVFSWSGASGGVGAQVDSYDIYWGNDPAGTEVTEQATQEEYDPDTSPQKTWKAGKIQDASGVAVFYLRMRVHDDQGRTSPWGTVFTFDYDGNPPTSEVSPAPDRFQPGPTFEIGWTGSDGEGESGLAGVQVWFDKDNSGWLQYGDIHSASEIVFDTGPTGGSGAYELYVRAVDNAGNVEPRPEKPLEIVVGSLHGDLLKILEALGSQTGSLKYEAGLDLDEDGAIGPGDLFLFPVATQ